MELSGDPTGKHDESSKEQEKTEGVDASNESKSDNLDEAQLGGQESCTASSTNAVQLREDGKSAVASTSKDAEEDKPLSKKQLKKKRRMEQMREKHAQKKQRARETKRAKAIAEGRDLDEERRIQEERTKSGEGWKRRETLWVEKMKLAENSFRVCIDCAYEDQMTRKEINSLASQIRYCYAANRKSVKPVYLSVSSLAGTTRANMDKVEGFPKQWMTRAFECSDTLVTDMHPKEKLVYLTSDSENELEYLEDDKIYVIGGIVDRNRLQRAAITRAEKLGIVTAKLPIASHLRLFTTKVLTCNHVFEIMLKYRQHDRDWKKAMLDVLPARKDARDLENDENGKLEKKESPVENKDAPQPGKAEIVASKERDAEPETAEKPKENAAYVD